MSTIWQSTKSLANAVPKYKSQHPCNLKQTCCCIHQSFELICHFAKQICTTNNVPILMKTILLLVNVSCIIANILFFQAIAVPYLEGSTRFPILVVVMLVVCLQTCGEYIVYNDTQLTLQGLRKHANMLVRPRLTTSRLLVSCLAQLILQRFCMPQQDLPFGDKSLTFVTRHYVTVIPASWSTSFGSAIRHRLSKVDSIAQFRQREAPLLLYMFVNPAC